MKKGLGSIIALSTASVLLLAGCGSGVDTYVKEAPLAPDEPANSTSIIVTSDNGSSSGVSYIEVADGSILVTCGDNCGVYIAVPVDSEASTTNIEPTSAQVPTP